MADTGMSCVKCGAPNDKMWQLCSTCAGNKAELQAKSKAGPQVVNVPAWNQDLQAAKQVQGKSFPYFSNNADEVADDLLADAGGHVNDRKATNLDGQYTVRDYGDTITLDYQGTRQGGNTLWMDYQGQVGGGGSKRVTYFQVMIQCCGQLPSAAVVVNALRASLTGGSKRAVLYFGTTIDRPK